MKAATKGDLVHVFFAGCTVELAAGFSWGVSKRNRAREGGLDGRAGCGVKRTVKADSRECASACNNSGKLLILSLMSRMETQGAEENMAGPVGGSFVTTRWSLVLAARDRDSPDGDEALESLCRQYWYPLYGFVRGMGHSAHDAQDLTQEFFSRLLAKEYLRVVDPERGRFRTFLRMAVRRFLANEWQKTQALKRGGGAMILALDTVHAEERLQSDFGGPLAPDVAYDRRWAVALLKEASERLEREYARASKRAHYETLKPYLTAERGSIPYAAIAEGLGTDEGAARVAIHRMRKRFRKLFRDAVGDTVGTAAEVEPEFQYVVSVLGQIGS